MRQVKIVRELDSCGGLSGGCHSILVTQYEVVGATLSEPHTSGTALRMCKIVCLFAYLLACLLAAICRKF